MKDWKIIMKSIIKTLCGFFFNTFSCFYAEDEKLWGVLKYSSKDYVCRQL